jgi:hypothetical protein
MSHTVTQLGMAKRGIYTFRNGFFEQIVIKKKYSCHDALITALAEWRDSQRVNRLWNDVISSTTIHNTSFDV